MARAKHTDRAEARRRYRQAQGFVDDEGAAPNTAGEPDPRPAARPTPPERPSITAAFRQAYRPANLRDDLAALPRLIRTRSFLISLALVIVGFAAVVVAPTSPVSNLAFQALVIPPAMAPIFVVGFFAPRASYLLGLIVALVDVAAYTAFVYGIAPSLASEPFDPVQQQELVISAISVGPPSGIFFAAAAAWYRRFLSLTNTGARRQAEARRRQQQQEQRRRARANR